MKKTVWNLVRAVILVAAVAFVLVRPDVRVAKAAGCPDASEVGSNCQFNGGYPEDMGGGQTRWTCFYTCYGGYGGGGEHMYIEQTVYVYD